MAMPQVYPGTVEGVAEAIEVVAHAKEVSHPDTQMIGKGYLERPISELRSQLVHSFSTTEKKKALH
jgi:hypothetical protein